MKFTLTNMYRFSLRVITVLVLSAALLLVWSLGYTDSVLPPPPKIGSQTFQADDPIGYLVGSIRYVVFLALSIIVVFALIGFSSGLIAEVNEARKKGEWGRFSVYFGAGLIVILVVIFGAWWGSQKLSATLIL